MSGEGCSFCLNKHGYVCAKCCENRHTLVKNDLNELHARIERLEKYLKENP